MKWNLVILIIYVNFLNHFYAYPNGAPEGTCDEMRPFHGNTQPQTRRSPYKVIPKSKGNSVEVTIEDPDDNTPFRGFLIKAFQDGTAIDGEFNIDSGQAKSLKCLDGEKSALTHNDRSDKRKITTTWQPFQRINGDVTFKATVVQTGPVYWVGIESESVPINTGETTRFTGSSTRRKSTSLLTTVQPPSDLYSGCASTKGCFGMPDNCVVSKNCQIILTFSRNRDGSYHFRMSGGLRQQSEGWIAAGLSKDDKMGNDVVTECLYGDGRNNMRQSWNFDKPRKGNRILDEPPSITDLESQYENGVISCSWNSPSRIVSNDMVFNLADEYLYIFLATGPVDEFGEKIVHNAISRSANAVSLTSATLVETKTQVLFKLHGAFMTAAWIGFVSIGILIARHYKEVWVKYNLCGVKVWFAIHRCFMILSVCLIIIGFIVVFVEVGGWSQVAPNPHPILGCIATILAVLQPFIAAVRPHPDHPKRPIFRWIHGLVGNGGQLIAVINMFFAVTLRSSNLPQAFNWVLVTFIIFHCLAHLLIHIHTCLMERERDRVGNGNVPSNHLQFMDSYVVNNDDGAGSAFKKYALSLYSVVTTGITIALILMICLN